MIGMFFTASIHNIDVEIKSSLASTSLHDTAASINQHPPYGSLGITREVLPLGDSRSKLQELSNWYTDVIPFHLPNDIIVPELIKSNPPVITSDKLCMGHLWLNNKSNSSWALFHSQVETLKLPQYQDLSAMLSMWRYDSKSPATIKHLLTVLMQKINYPYPGQTAVVGLYQPLYAIAKRIQ